MKTKLFTTVAALVLTAAVAASGIGANETASRSSVEFHEPDNFTDFRSSDMRTERDQQWLASELRKEIERVVRRELPQGYHIKLRFHDIDMAGDFEPWRSPQYQDVRIVREIYPPRMTLQYEVTNAAGEVVARGERTLSNLNYMNRLRINHSDPLRYETDLLDDFIREVARGLG